MKYSEAGLGRVFVLRLEDGDVIHGELEAFVREKGIKAASVVILGGADVTSCLVVGPEQGRVRPIVPQTRILDKVHEVTGTGTLFPGEDGEPSLHLHLSCGNGDHVLTGCVRNGVRVWHIMEVVIQELTDGSAVRKRDPVTGFELLNP